MTTPTTTEALQAAQAAEYGQYVAAEDIRFGGALAFNEGDPVPASHVTDGKVRKDQVRKVATKTEAVAAVTTEKG